MKNYYDILGVKTNASASNIEKAYNTVISKYNPDNFQGEAKGFVEQRIADAKEAYSVLSDSFLRSQYDKELGIKAPEQNQNATSASPEAQRRAQTERLTAPQKNNEQKKEKSKVGTAKGVMDVASALYQNISKFKIHKPTKTGVLALLAAIAIVVLVVAILWFIPFTRSFIESFIFFW